MKCYEASIQCWAIIGTPAKRHLNAASLAGRLWSAYSGIRILSSLIKNRTKKNNKKRQWQTFWIRACVLRSSLSGNGICELV